MPATLPMPDTDPVSAPADAARVAAPASGRWRRKCALSLGLAGLLLATLIVARAPLLRGAAHAWVINDPVQAVDAIVILPQVSGKPLPEAVRLHREGVAARLFMPSAPVRPTDRLGLTTPFDVQNHRLMRELGVPESAFEIVGQPALTAHEAAEAVATWAKAQKLRSVLVVTELFQTRRVKWAVERALAPLGVAVSVRGVPVPDYQLDEWWRNEQGLIHFENEVVLNLFYRWNY